MINYHFVRISTNNIDQLKSFINSLSEEVSTFRYFVNRDISVINNHIYTVILYVGDQAVGYGHLDKEGGVVWLGIVIKKDFQGMGFGNLMIKKLLEYAKKVHIKHISLTVDNDNPSAIYLYEKYGFIEKNKSIKNTLFKLTIN